MQIRLGNRQDEAAISKLVFDVMREFGLEPKPDGAEADLKNIEQNYFARDGVFLVVEMDKEIVGIAGARRNTDNELELVRLAVGKSHRGHGFARELMRTVVNFAKDMGYQRVEVEPARQYPGGDRALMAWGFTSDDEEDAQPVWYFDTRLVDFEARACFITPGAGKPH
jgi:predicted N-acetyltransferase YhbS